MSEVSTAFQAARFPRHLEEDLNSASTIPGIESNKGNKSAESYVKVHMAVSPLESISGYSVSANFKKCKKRRERRL